MLGYADWGPLFRETTISDLQSASLFPDDVEKLT